MPTVTIVDRFVLPRQIIPTQLANDHFSSMFVRPAHVGQHLCVNVLSIYVRHLGPLVHATLGVRAPPLFPIGRADSQDRMDQRGKPLIAALC